MEDTERYGLLLGPSIKLHRQWFRETCKLLGINVLYRAPLPGKKWTNYAEMDTNFAPPIKVGCLFDEHPTQQSMKKMGWISELNGSNSIIHVDYDLPGLQQGALFIVPGGLDNTKGRLFRVVKLTNSIVYPASIMCEIAPEYEDTMDVVATNDFKSEDFTLINEDLDTEQFLDYTDDLSVFKSSSISKEDDGFLWH